ncbi:MAG: TolC family protein [Planctomycetes bacterium]|nr:TolC family protein [Planctomycetota bacterium]
MPNCKHWLPQRQKAILSALLILVFLVASDSVTISQDKTDDEDGIFDETVITRDPFSLLRTGKEDVLPLSLEECVFMGLAQNFSLQSSELESKLADADKELAESQVDFVFPASTTYKRIKQSTIENVFTGSEEDRWVTNIGFTKAFETGTSLTFGMNYANTETDSTYQQTSDSARVSIKLRQNLLKNFGLEQNRYSIDIADISKQIKEAMFDQVKLDLIYNIVNGFWSEVYAIEDYNVTFSAMLLAKDEVDIIKRKKAAGLATGINVFAAQAQLESKKKDLIEKAKSVRDASDTLLALISPDRVVELVKGGLFVLVKPREYSMDIGENLKDFIDAKTHIRKALSIRPELKQSNLSLKTAEDNVKYQEDQLMPNLDLILGFNFSGAGNDFGKAMEYLWNTSNTEFEVGFEFSYPLGNRSERAKYKKAQINREKAVFSKRSAEVSIITDVLKAIRKIQAANMTYKASKIAKELAEKQLKSEKELRKLGEATDFQVQEYQNELEQANRDEISAKISLKLAIAELKKSTGVLPEDYLE